MYFRGRLGIQSRLECVPEHSETTASINNKHSVESLQGVHCMRNIQVRKDQILDFCY